VTRFVLTVVLAGAVVGLVATPTVPSAAAHLGAAEAGKLRLTVSEKGHVMPFPPAGTFVLAGTAGADSGKSSVTPREVRSGARDGQSFKVVQGTNAFYGRKGDLFIRFSGVAIDLATDTDVEYGTWSIYRALGTGMYEGWQGGGRWASSSKDGRYLVRWEGLIKR
jgi:hypothetical protein